MFHCVSLCCKKHLFDVEIYRRHNETQETPFKNKKRAFIALQAQSIYATDVLSEVEAVEKAYNQVV